jgi:hypothetical protein
MWPIFFSLLNDHDVLPLINLLIWFVVQVTVVARSRCAGPGVLIPVSFVVQAIDTVEGQAWRWTGCAALLCGGDHRD